MRSPRTGAGNGQGAVAVAAEPSRRRRFPSRSAPRSGRRCSACRCCWPRTPGFRLPNLWSATLYTTSLPDGFHRRFLVGTLLRPFAEALDYDYWLYATVAFAILGALLVVLVVATLRARLVSQRFLVVACFLLPTGGSSSTRSATSTRCCTSCCSPRCGCCGGAARMGRRAGDHVACGVHTRDRDPHRDPDPRFRRAARLEPRRAIASRAALLVALILLVIPTIDHGAVTGSRTRCASRTSRPGRRLSLFQRSPIADWDLYRCRTCSGSSCRSRSSRVFGFFLLTGWAHAARPSTLGALPPARRPVRSPRRCCSRSPAGTSSAGRSCSRQTSSSCSGSGWVGSGRELNPLQWVTLAAVVLVSLHAQLLYFDGYEPRSLRPAAIRELAPRSKTARCSRSRAARWSRTSRQKLHSFRSGDARDSKPHSGVRLRRWRTSRRTRAAARFLRWWPKILLVARRLGTPRGMDVGDPMGHVLRVRGVGPGPLHSVAVPASSTTAWHCCSRSGAACSSRRARRPCGSRPSARSPSSRATAVSDICCTMVCSTCPTNARASAAH